VYLFAVANAYKMWFEHAVKFIQEFWVTGRESFQLDYENSDLAEEYANMIKEEMATLEAALDRLIYAANLSHHDPYVSLLLDATTELIDERSHMCIQYGFYDIYGY
jgi:hypothetical protein